MPTKVDSPDNLDEATTRTSKPRPKNTGSAKTGHSHGQHPAESQPQGRGAAGDQRPLGSYGAIMGCYGIVAGALVIGLRSRKSGVRQLSLKELLLLALATEHLSRLITKDSVTAPLRAPFTEFEEPAGEGEVNEEVVGTGLRHALGELVTCPFCIAQWLATALVAGSVVAPQFTTAAISVSAVARTSDYLQLTYGLLRQRQ